MEAWPVHVFTSVPGEGNPAAVVFDADALSDAARTALAARLNPVSETVFVLAPRDPAHDLALRYFTRTGEVDLCGHGTLAALFALAWSGRARPAHLAVETVAGALAASAHWEGGALRRASVTLLTPTHGPSPDAALAAAVLGLPRDALDDAPPALCHAGLWACFVRLRALDALAAARPRGDAIDRLWPGHPELTGVYPYVVLARGAGLVRTQGRFFSPPRYGIDEDPVTGTASAGLGAHLARRGELCPGDVLLARQGVELGRPGEVRVEVGAAWRMRIGGAAALGGRGPARFTDVPDGSLWEPRRP